MTDDIQIQTIERIRVIRFNRPDKRNALTHTMYESLVTTLLEANADPAVRCILFAGSETVFTAGNDIADFLQNPPTGGGAPVMRLLALLTEIEKPMLAAVCGPAVGIGTTLLLHCDLVACGEQTSFAMPFVNLGLCVEGGASLLLAQRVGAARAREWLLLGEPIDSQTAFSAGLVNRVLPNDLVFTQAFEWARKLAAKPPTALQSTRRLIRQGSLQATRETIAAEAAEFRDLLQSAEAKEAFAAFMEKRKPDFSRF